jgi:hypothetical protein
MISLRLGVLGLVLAAGPLSAQSSRFEFRLGGLVQASRSNTSIGPSSSAVLSRVRGSLAGGEFLIRSSGIGLGGRYLIGNLDSASGAAPRQRLQVADARILMGPRVFTVEGGAMYRRLEVPSTSYKREWYYARAGARSTVAIGASGLSTLLAGAYYPYVIDKGGKSGGKGWEWEAGVSYSRRGIPAYVSIGYRYQTFQPATTTNEPQSELSGVFLSGGLRLAN